MKNKVVSQALSKRLYEKGVRFESEFYWWGYNFRDGKDTVYELNHKDFIQGVKEEAIVSKYPALLSSEIGQLLPKSLLDKQGEEYKTVILNRGDGWSVSFMNNYMENFYLPGMQNFIHHKNEAEARGLMLEYLIDQNLIDI